MVLDTLNVCPCAQDDAVAPGYGDHAMRGHLACCGMHHRRRTLERVPRRGALRFGQASIVHLFIIILIRRHLARPLSMHRAKKLIERQVVVGVTARGSQDVDDRGLR